MPVYTTVTLLEPLSIVNLNWEDSGSGTLQRLLPEFLNGVAWRVSSIDLTITSASQQAVLIRLFGAALTGQTTSFSEVTLRSRPFVISGAPTQIKMKNGRNVQHASSSAAVPLVQVAPVLTSATANFTVSGIVVVTVKGGI